MASGQSTHFFENTSNAQFGRVDIMHANGDIHISYDSDRHELLQDINRVVKETKDDMDKNNANIQGTLKTIKDDHLVKSEIRQWLDAPDSSRNYNDAHDRRQENTCSWFLEGSRFRELQENAGFLWIKGTAGCGKTVLCSSIIDKIVKLQTENKSVHYAYFFFDGRDSQENLQRHDKLIRSLIWQLSLQCDGLPAVLAELYGHGHQQPFTSSLEDTLHHIIAGLHSTFIVIDSLDECTEREKTLRWIERITSSISGLHMVVASRPERDIKDVLQELDPRCVDLVNEAANNDITTYLEQELVLVTKWNEETRMVVQSTLTKGAQGMFRWVALQLMELKKCSNHRSLMNQLNNLPQGLYETYDRILSKVNNSMDGPDTKTFLRWLCFSIRPLKLVEIAETVVVDFNTANGPQYTRAHHYWEPQDVLEKCAGLIAEFGEGNVKLAHFSIKEYLLSKHLLRTTSQFHLESSELSHSLIARTCLAYLLHFDTIDMVDKDVDTQFPLAPYAARYWIPHARSGDINKLEQPFTTVALAQQLFAPNKAWFNWVRIWDLDKPFFDEGWSRADSTLYYAASAGLEQLSLRLLEKGADVNAPGGRYGYALQAALYHGHEAIVKLLLEKGADMNGQGGLYGNALLAASHRGHEQTVKLLLEMGADINAQGGLWGSALQAASAHGHNSIVKLLVEKGMDVNEQGGFFGNALQAASNHGHEQTVKLLLDMGANINAQGGRHGSALQAASANGHESTVKLLLEKGADVNARGGMHGSALQEASFGGHEQTVTLLLDMGADINAQGGHGSALQAASARGHTGVVKLLLEKGADVNGQGGLFDNALQAASNHGHEQTVKLLLEMGTDINAQGGLHGSALQAASAEGHEGTVKLLLEKGADVNARGGKYWKAVHAAAIGQHQRIVDLLLQNGAIATTAS